MTILAIDQGTTSTKAFLLHEDGRFVTVGSRKHEQIHPGDGLIEHDAAELIANVEALIGEALAGAGDIAGIALANQGETVVAWDRQTGRPLHNAIVWQDQRTQGLLDALPDATKEIITAESGLPIDAYFSASKLAWLLAHAPEARELANAGRLGLATSDAFFIERLTGVYASDITTASRTSLMTLETGTWSATLCEIVGVPQNLLPSIVPTTGVIGAVQRNGRTLPLVASAVDQQAALFGHGCRTPGDLKITFGTGSFALALTGDQPRRDAAGLVPTVAWQLGNTAPVFALDGGDYTAAAAVDWARSVGLAGSLADFDLEDGPSALERGLVFVPSLAGLAAPHWDRQAGGAFMGLRLGTTSADMRRAVLEGVALRAVELVEALAGESAAEVSVDGGLTKNATFLQFLADALGRPLRVAETAELTGLGAAELGYVALGKAAPPRSSGSTRHILPSSHSAGIRAKRATFASAITAVQDFGSA